MGETSAVDIDACVRSGGHVVTASERAARSLTLAFHRARRAEGLTAWPAPNIQDWQSFVRTAWNERILDGRLILSLLQEQSLWTAIVASATPNVAQLVGTSDRLAAMAMDAHSLLCAFAPQFLNARTRSGWDQDAAVFSAWLSAFDESCRDGNVISAARLPLELTDALASDITPRSPLLLAGFDRILPVQKNLFAAWGACTQAPSGEAASQIAFHHAPDPSSELAASALWCKRQLTANPAARLLVVTQDVPKRRGEIERAFLRFLRADASASTPASLFEFSLGVPLSQVALPRSAGLLLHWLNGPIDEHELDWLLSTGHLAASPEESLALTAFMRSIRRRGWQRTRWLLTDFLHQNPGQPPPASWAERLTQAQHRLADFARLRQSPLEWAELVPKLLETAGWPGSRPLSSAEFQAFNRWQQTLDGCASLGFNAQSMEWKDFLAALTRAVAETLFAPQSEDAPLLIAGPAESAGLTADAIWFLGASEEAWPAAGATHPLLPLAVQREAGMPHATAQLDWDLATATTSRLLTSAPEIHFSYPRQSDGVDARPSKIITQLAGWPLPVPPELLVPSVPAPITIAFHDISQLPFSPGNTPGGSGVLTAQSQCPFKAFAVARLAAQDWDPAEAGLTASERGQLLHSVLHSIWAGPPLGIHSHAELLAVQDLASFVAGHARRVLRDKMPARARQSMPQRYIALEETRLINLVTEWLRYESTRVPFTVEETEQDALVSVDSLNLRLRLDRIDHLNDDTFLVIDYKSGYVTPNDWDLPRPNDVQLPLYAGFALKPDQPLGGLVFAKLRAGETNREFVGRVNDARATLLPNLSSNSNLAKKPLTPDAIDAWRDYIEQLARDFLAGRATVDPREYPETCERCGLQALCRIQENQPQSDAARGDDSEDFSND